MKPIFCGHWAEGNKTGSCFRAGKAGGNETHILQLQNLILGGHGAEGNISQIVFGSWG